VIFVAFYEGFGPGLLAVGLSALIASFWIEKPNVFSSADMTIIIIFVIVALLIVWSFERMRRATRLRSEPESEAQPSAKTLAKQTEVLRVAEERLAFAMEVGRLGIWDLEGLTHDSLESQQHDTIIGYELPLSKWTYEIFLIHVLDEDRPKVKENFQRAMAADVDWSFECRIHHSDGELRWVWVQIKHSVNPSHLWGLVQDITDRKLLEEALCDSETRYRTIFETAADGIITIDAHGIIVEANPAVEKLFGYEADELKGLNVAMLMPSPYREHHDEYIGNYLRTGIKKIIGIGREVVALRKDGSTFPIHLAVGEMRVKGDLMFIGQVHDITESKRVEENLKVIEIAEAASNAKDRFLAILSHELRTPLTPALITVGSHEMDMTLPSSLRDDLGTIRRNLELEARLIDDLLDLNRLAHGKIELRLQVRDLHHVLRSVMEICRNNIKEKGLVVRLELNAAEHNVNCDSGRLQQIFWNLLKNASKFTPVGGTITIRTSNPRDGIVRVEISDTGIGIAPELIPRLFVPFEQGQREITQHAGGLGLGLTISKSLVDLHGGTIWANSEGQGKGATFTVELLVSRAVASIDEIKHQNAVANWKSKIGDRKPRILLVEDNEDTLRTLSLLLTRKGCDITGVASIRAALAAAQSARGQGAEKFDFVISDLGLPDGDGRDLMRELHERDGLFGIAISGYGMEEDIAKSLAAGFDEHLTKPIQIEELQEAICNLIG
jgi:PAS domain S-box-containing protein